MDRKLDSTDFREFDPDLITITAPRKRRTDRPIVGAADLFKERSGIFGMLGGLRTTSLPQQSERKPHPNTVFKAYWLAREASAKLDLLDVQRMGGLHVRGEDRTREFDEKQDAARREWEEAVEALLRIPAKTDHEFSYKTGGDVLRAKRPWLRKYRPEWAKMLDEERARLDSEKAARKAARAARREA